MIKLKTITFQILFLLINTFSVSAQCTLEIKLTDSREERMGNPNKLETGIFSLYKQDSLIYYSEWEKKIMTIENLKTGLYRMEYQTLYYRTYNKFIYLDEAKKYEVRLHTDSINLDHEICNSFIRRLEEGEKYSLYIADWGCLTYSDDYFEFSRTKKGYFITYGEIYRKLTDEELCIIEKFENEASIHKPGSCTASIAYHFCYNEELTIYWDYSCEWDGYYFLLLDLQLPGNIYDNKYNE